MSYPLRSAPATSVRPPRAHARLGPRRRVVIIMSSGTRSGCVRVRSQLHGAISPSPHHASSSESSLGRRTAVCSAAPRMRVVSAVHLLVFFSYRIHNARGRACRFTYFPAAHARAQTRSTALQSLEGRRRSHLHTYIQTPRRPHVNPSACNRWSLAKDLTPGFCAAHQAALDGLDVDGWPRSDLPVRLHGRTARN